MAQETWGLKLDAELKEKVQDIIKSDFESSKDFLEQLVSTYELNKIKQGESVLTSEVEELESLTRRINGIFINANARVNTMLRDKDVQAEKQVELKSQLIERLQVNISKLEQEKVDAANKLNDIDKLNEEYKEEIKHLTESNQTLNALVTEYKDKNDTLAGLLAEYKEDGEDAKKVRVENNELKDKLYSAEDQVSKYENEISRYKEQLVNQEDRYKMQLQDKANNYNESIQNIEAKLQEQEKAHKESIEQVEERNRKELETVRREAEVEANLKILELQQEYQKKIQDIQERHNIEIEQYQGKYKDLLEKLEENKVSTIATPKGSKGTTSKSKKNQIKTES
ncbi:hypothetical protein [Clostridium sp.]|uniref:hypothetical protein n=1 Tax=Clostridium sp. TaxID=1506 RepID=UPI003F379DD9